MRQSRILRLITNTLMLALFTFLPTAAHAAGIVAQTEGEGAGVGIVMGLLALILILLAVIAVIGAVALGIIGLGYNSIQGDD